MSDLTELTNIICNILDLIENSPVFSFSIEDTGDGYFTITLKIETETKEMKK